MVGMLQIMTYLLCVYLIFKGVEIFMIAYMSAREKRFDGITIGVLIILLSLVAAGYFIQEIDKQANTISDSFNSSSQTDSDNTLINSPSYSQLNNELIEQEKRENNYTILSNKIYDYTTKGYFTLIKAQERSVWVDPYLWNQCTLDLKKEIYNDINRYLQLVTKENGPIYVVSLYDENPKIEKYDNGKIVAMK